MTRARGLAGLLLSLSFGAAGCRDASVRGAPDAGSPLVAPPPVVAETHGDAGLAARCSLATNGAPGDVQFGDAAELGEAVPLVAGFAVGMLRAQDGGRVASVIRIGGAVVAPPVDLGPSRGDAPPPQPLVRGGELYAVGYVGDAAVRSASAGGHRPGRALRVFHLGGAVELLASLAPESDASSAYDVIAATASGSPVGALVAWDDALAPAGGGAVQLATLSADLRAVRSVRAFGSAAEGASGAGDPRVVLRPSGYWLTWVSRRPERRAPPLPLPAGEIETPSEEAAFGWVEAVPLDAEGAPAGPARRLTSATGHVASYAVYSREGALVVVAEDDGPASSRGGGSLERVVWRGDGAPESTSLVHAGVEEETPPLIILAAGGDAWLSFLDLAGDTEIAPLPPAGASRPAGPAPRLLASREPLFSRARILGPLGDRLAFATADGPRWTLRWATCLR